MIENILVPIDGSEEADRAVKFAGELAAKHGASLHIFHVLLEGGVPEHLLELAGKKPEELASKATTHVVGDYDQWMAGSYKEMIEMATSASLSRETLEDIADKLLARAKEAAQSQGAEQITVAHAAGTPAPQILKHAHEVNADTVVMGARGLGAFGEVSVGGVCHKIQRMFPGTVVTVR
jgi:nucleotide-binding universal stress UspA family protein